MGIFEVRVAPPEVGVFLHSLDSPEQPVGISAAGHRHSLVVKVAHHFVDAFIILKFFFHFLLAFSTAQRHRELNDRNAEACVGCSPVSD